ncbi:hypothetical protein [Sorangium sp. So ce1335]|uniref:hypothetical protein n=1 Tax=Sorangium sp. So ce1335 TaxID=3133335 RepID=UPI003F63F803
MAPRSRDIVGGSGPAPARSRCAPPPAPRDLAVSICSFIQATSAPSSPQST